MEMVDYADVITTVIMTVRGKRVILDTDLARIYGVPTRRLNEQVRRDLTPDTQRQYFGLTNTYKIHIIQTLFGILRRPQQTYGITPSSSPMVLRRLMIRWR